MNSFKGSTLSNKDFAKYLFILALITLLGMHLLNSDEAGAQTNPPPAGLLCHSATQVALDIQTDAPDGVQPQPGDTVTVSWSQLGERTTDHKWIDGSGLCTFDVAFYTHGDNQVLRPHPDSTLVAHTENVLPEIVHTERLGRLVLWQRFQLTFTVPEYDTDCTDGTQIDIYRDTVGSDGTWGPGVGPIESFDTNDDDVIDRRYSDEFRLVDAFNWESETDLCVPTTTTEQPTTTTTEPEPTTTIPDPTTTSTSNPVSTTTTEQSTSTTVNDTTSTTTPISSTVVDTTSSTINVCTSDPVLNNVGRDSNGRFCAISTVRRSLPHTGSQTGNLVMIGVALIIIGTFCALDWRRRQAE